MKQEQPSPYFDKRKKKIIFHIAIGAARHITLVGTFNHWAKDVLEMKPDKKDTWTIAIPMLPRGRYHYKFLIDDKMWMEDIENPLREPDGVAGWNSVLTV